MKRLVFFLEGRSEKNFLEVFLPRAYPALADRAKFAPPVYVTFEGKQDLQKQLPGKLRGWRAPDTFFIVLQDQDGEDCKVAKKRLLDLCAEAGRSDACVVRIACRELENWYLGDLAAVAAIYGGGLQRLGQRARFRRNRDALYGAQEMERITAGKYQKIDGSRRIAEQMNRDYRSNQSHSIRVFCQAMAKIAGGLG